MAIDPLSDEKIIDSWHKNGVPWTQAVRGEQIESRKLVTNRAIIEAIARRSPRSMLDIGCGEGWLCREMAARNISAIGLDVVPGLIEQAQKAGGGEFRVASYKDIAEGRVDACVDVAVCNFALIGDKSVNDLFKNVPSLLKPQGSFIVQTLHPVVACGDAPYRDGWREGSWAGFSSDFTDPAPWYFRTLGSWVRLFVESGFSLTDIREPVHPKSRKPASLLLIGQTRS